MHQDASYSSDETHPLWNLKDSSGRSNPYIRGADIGGPLDITSVKHDVPMYSASFSEPPGFIWKRYTGDVGAYFVFSVPDNQTVPLSASQIISSIPESIDPLSVRFAQGGTAISRCAPARPEAGLTVSLVELIKDGVPSALSKMVQARDHVERFRSTGKDYLNVEFGWKPFVSDIRKTLQSITDQEKILEDLSRNSGRRMRRRYAFEGKSDVEVVTDDVLPWPPSSHDFFTQTRHVRTTTSTKKTWFSGEFVYRVPDLHGIGGVGAQARHLLGLDLTPTTLYNATPWTWLADWIGNTGDVLANISAMNADDLVMRYGYLMQETKMVVQSHHSGVRLKPGWLGWEPPSTITGSVEFKRQTRCAASPFGFGLTSLDFSPRQWAVLAALGISRGR